MTQLQVLCIKYFANTGTHDILASWGVGTEPSIEAHPDRTCHVASQQNLGELCEQSNELSKCCVLVTYKKESSECKVYPCSVRV